MKLKLKILATAFLMGCLFLNLFPQILTFVGMPMFLSFTWETALVRLMFSIVICYLVVLLWGELKIPKWIFPLLTILSLYAVLTTPEFTTGGWIYSAPDREETALYWLTLFTFLFSTFNVWRSIRSFLPRRDHSFRRKEFFLKSAIVFVAIFLVFFLGSTDSHFDGILNPYGKIPDRIYSTFFIGGIIAGLFYELIHTYLVRIKDLGYSRHSIWLLVIPFCLLTTPDFPGAFFFLLGVPFYVIVFIVLYFLPPNHRLGFNKSIKYNKRT